VFREIGERISSFLRLCGRPEITGGVAKRGADAYRPLGFDLADVLRLPVRTRSYINVMLLVVLALRSLLPAGYMVQAAPEGAFEIVICTSAGLQLATLDLDDTGPSPKPSHADGTLCPFASGGTAALADAAPQSLASEAQYAAVTYTLAAALFAETPKPGAASARGPPSTLI
jgi:hypothetical protein